MTNVGRAWPSHGQRRQRARQQLAACIDRIRIQSSTLAAVGIDGACESEVDPELVLRLRTLAPTIDAQIKAAASGNESHNDRQLVGRSQHLLSIGAKHIFTEPMAQLTPSRVARLQRGRRCVQDKTGHGDLGRALQHCTRRSATTTCPGCLLFFPVHDLSGSWSYCGGDEVQVSLREDARRFGEVGHAALSSVSELNTTGRPSDENYGARLAGEGSIDDWSGDELGGTSLCGETWQYESRSNEDLGQTHGGDEPHDDSRRVETDSGDERRGSGDELGRPFLFGEAWQYERSGNADPGAIHDGHEPHDDSRPVATDGGDEPHESGDEPKEQILCGETWQSERNCNKYNCEEELMSYPMYGHGFGLSSWRQRLFHRLATLSVDNRSNSQDQPHLKMGRAAKKKREKQQHRRQRQKLRSNLDESEGAKCHEDEDTAQSLAHELVQAQLEHSIDEPSPVASSCQITQSLGRYEFKPLLRRQFKAGGHSHEPLGIISVSGYKDIDAEEDGVVNDIEQETFSKSKRKREKRKMKTQQNGCTIS